MDPEESENLTAESPLTFLFLINDKKKYEFALELKNEATALFREQKVEESFHKFSKSLKILILADDEFLYDPNPKALSKEKLMTMLYNNMACCHVAKRNWESVIDLCTIVLEKESYNIKALFRRATAYIEVQEYEKARVDLKKILEKGDNAMVLAKLAILRDKERLVDKRYADGLKKMFN